jgi:hypothetical protein
MTTTRDTMERMRGFSSLFLRLALGLSFLSALADRFGLWGALKALRWQPYRSIASIYLWNAVKLKINPSDLR